MFLTDIEPYRDVIIYNGKCPDESEKAEEFEEVQRTVQEQNDRIADFCKDSDDNTSTPTRSTNAPTLAGATPACTMH